MLQHLFDRSSLGKGIALLVLTIPIATRSHAGEEHSAAKTALVEAVESIGIVVSDLDRSVEFFTKVLAFETVSELESTSPDLERLEGVFGLRVRTARLRLGEELIDLTEYLAPRGRPVPQDSRSNDLWFQHIAIITRDMPAAYAWLRKHRVEHVSSGPQRLPDWNKNAGGIKAFHFKDPDGHVLEILEFPPEKGDPKWSKPSDRLFLGIDHTAIAVSDTEASLRLYRDILGLRVVGESENHGAEQEHLNSVFGARLRITALRAASGPGIELLEYLAPGGGRPAPPEARSCDLTSWQTRVVTRKLELVAGEMRTGRYQLVSPGIVSLSESAHGFSRGLVSRDPDRHAIKIIERNPLTESEKP